MIGGDGQVPLAAKPVVLDLGPGALVGDEDVRLRPFRPADAAAHEAGEDDEIRRWFHFPRASNAADVEAFIARSAHSLRVDGPRRTFAIEADLGRGWQVCGHVEANHFRAGATNLSYSLYPEARGRGLAVRAVRLAMTDARRALPVVRFVIRVSPANSASVRVAERCRFVFAGLFFEEERLHWEFEHDEVPRRCESSEDRLVNSESTVSIEAILDRVRVLAAGERPLVSGLSSARVEIVWDRLPADIAGVQHLADQSDAGHSAAGRGDANQALVALARAQDLLRRTEALVAVSR